MSIESLSAAAESSAFAMMTLQKGLSQEATQMAQLLQTLPPPPAPLPAHLGNAVNVQA